MVFDSPLFIFLFLPLIILIYHASPKQARSSALLGASLLFYAWGNAHALLILILSIAVNYVMGLALQRFFLPGNRKLLLTAAIVANLGLLVFYKYLRFAVDNLGCLGVLDAGRFDWAGWQIPLGISFFTFGAIAYHMDISRGKAKAEKNLIRFGLYMSHFAKVIAGPIVRYVDVADGLKTGSVGWEDFAWGVRRFVIGLAKKVLVANQVALFADVAFKNANGIDMPTAWLGILCYSLQLYFDFSGYSDMAMGLGRMFGLRFMENFNYPYISRSIQEFWRRWHISLSTWFRDYLYIPLGGNRVSTGRSYLNLFLVFFLCGLWHGASWNFIVWGAFHGVFLVLERAGLGPFLSKLWKPLRHLYAILVVMIGWVFFRADDLPQAMTYLKAMFGFSFDAFPYYSMNHLTRQLLVTLAIGVAGSIPLTSIVDAVRERIRTHGKQEALGTPRILNLLDMQGVQGSVTGTIFVLLLFIATVMQVAVSTYTPFIYAGF